jgi:hypothetical protein
VYSCLNEVRKTFKFEWVLEGVSISEEAVELIQEWLKEKQNQGRTTREGDRMSELDEIRSLLLETAQIANSNAKAISANSAEIAVLGAAIEQQRQELREQASETVEWFSGVVNQADEDRTLMREMQLEVRGLQIENRRILERLEGHFSDGHGAA